ncbi:MAG: DUF6445 family protein [Sphingomonadaceae bacterium]
MEAGFSLVTTPHRQLSPVQRTPHFDSVDPDFYAVMHYLASCAGTAFYRHRAGGTMDRALISRPQRIFLFRHKPETALHRRPSASCAERVQSYSMIFPAFNRNDMAGRTRIVRIVNAQRNITAAPLLRLAAQV